MAPLQQRQHDRSRAAGAPREGPTRLPGLVVCQHCGHRLRGRATPHAPSSGCDQAPRRFGEPIGQWASARRIDALVEEHVLGGPGAGAVELAAAQDQPVRDEARRVEQAWPAQLQRLASACDRARRRDELVDPANRLVAQTLETDWHTRRTELEAAQAQAARHQAPHGPTSRWPPIQAVVWQRRHAWDTGPFEARAKKALLRCVVHEVRVRREAQWLHAEGIGQGAPRSRLVVPKERFTPGRLAHQVQRRARDHTDAEMAAARWR